MPDLIAAPYVVALTRELNRSALPGAPVVPGRGPRDRRLRRRTARALYRLAGRLAPS